MKAFFREISVTLILAIVIFLLLQTTVQSFIVVGSSMEPNLQEGERLLVSKVVYNLHEPQRGDIVVFHPPKSQRVDFIKRIIALPGETVEVKDGVVYINGHQLHETYIKQLPKYTLRERKVPENEYFVLGDNRNNSNDSHNGWTVPRQKVIGKAWLSLWPPNKWGVIANYSLPDQLVSLTNN
jgi:signal peptidase I